MKIIAIFILSLTLRLLYLGSVPVSLSHDETDNIIQAHSVIQTGSDIEGKWKPWSLLPNSGVMAELSPLINVPVLSFLPQSLFSSRLTTAILSSIFPIMIWWWLTLIGVGSRVSKVAAILLAISPWHLIFSRTALEQPTSLFFYLLSWIMLAKIFQTKKSLSHYLMNFLLFTLTYMVGYFTYHGYKFSFPILTSIYSVWLYYYTKTKEIQKLSLTLVFIGLLVFRTFFYSEYYQNRSGEMFLSDQTSVVVQVNTTRRQSLAPEILNTVFTNKPTLIVATLVDKYFGALSPDLLFRHGESNGVFSVWKAGYFYAASLPFIILGLVSLISNYKFMSLLLLSLLVISPISTIIHVNNSYAFRSAMYFVILNIILAYGIIYFVDLIKKYFPKLYNLSIVAVGGIFLIGLISFCYIFYYITPVTNAKDFFFSDRLIGSYVRLSGNSKILLIEPQPRYIYSAIILSSGTPSTLAMNGFNRSYNAADMNTYEFDNLLITQSCPKFDISDYDTVIVDRMLSDDLERNCEAFRGFISNPEKSRVLSIVNPKDSGEDHRIYGDTLCRDLPLSRYVNPQRLTDFNIEQMSRETYCSKWIVAQ